jgi:hypothetical protein
MEQKEQVLISTPNRNTINVQIGTRTGCGPLQTQSGRAITAGAHYLIRSV